MDPRTVTLTLFPNLSFKALPATIQLSHLAYVPLLRWDYLDPITMLGLTRSWFRKLGRIFKNLNIGKIGAQDDILIVQ